MQKKLKNLKCKHYLYVFMFLVLIFVIATFSSQEKEVSTPKDRISFEGALYLSNFKTIGYSIIITRHMF